MNNILKILKGLFKSIFHRHRHNYKLIYSKELNGTYEWEECYRITAADLCSPGRSYYRTRKYEGNTYLRLFHCYECSDYHIELVYPGGIVQYTNTYLISLLYKHITQDELTNLINEKRND